MPRYVAQGIRTKYSQETKEAALHSFDTVAKGSYLNAGRLHGVPENTLRRWVVARQENKVIKLGCGSKTELEWWVERDLAELIVYLADVGRPIFRDDICDLVQSFVISSKTKTRFTDGRPGVDWVRNFEKRWGHVISRRKREGLSYNRAAGLSEENVNKFYDLFEELNNKHHFKPQNMWNTDESGFQGSSTTSTVYVGKQVKNAYDLQSGNVKAMYTVLFACNAAGSWLPPFTIYKSASLWYEWTLGGPEDARYGVNDSGWMLEYNFERWFLDVFLPLTTSNGEPRLLIFDGHNSHLSYNIAKAAFDANVHLLCLPPNCSHALQPLDVSCFRSAKHIWSEVCRKFYKGNANRNFRK